MNETNTAVAPAALEEALKKFGEATQGKCKPSALSGNPRRGLRAGILSTLLGRKVNQNDASVGMLRRELADALGVTASTDAVLDEQIQRACHSRNGRAVPADALPATEEGTDAAPPAESSAGTEHDGGTASQEAPAEVAGDQPAEPTAIQPEEVEMPKNDEPLRGGIGGAPPAAKEPKKPDVQAVLNELTYRHGKNFPYHPNSEGLLAQAGIQRSDITAARLAIADLHARSRLASVLEWDPPLVDNFEGMAEMHVWHERAGRYRIVRIAGSNARFSAIEKITTGGAREHRIADDMKSLREALAAVEKYHLTKTRREDVVTNGEAVLASARESGLDKRPRPAASEEPMTPSPEKENEMNVSERQARALLESMGLEAGPKVTVKRLTLKLNNLAETAGEGTKDPTGKEKELLDRISATLEAGKKITVGEVASKAGGGKPKGEGKTAPSSNGQGKDQYGCQIGKPPAQINAALSKKVKTAEEIAAESGQPVGRVKNHLRFWKAKGKGLGQFLVQSDKGWSVTK